MDYDGGASIGHSGAASIGDFATCARWMQNPKPEHLHALAVVTLLEADDGGSQGAFGIQAVGGGVANNVQ